MSFDNQIRVKNEEMHATYVANTEKLSEKICSIYKAACSCAIEDYDILMCMYNDIELLELADMVAPTALSTPNGPIRNLLEEYMSMYCEIGPFCNDARITHELTRLRMQVGVCIDAMRHRSDFNLHDNDSENTDLYGWPISSVTYDFI